MEPDSTQEQGGKRGRVENLLPHQFKKGQSGNPGGRPKGLSLKAFARELLECQTLEERLEFLEGLPKEVIWKMAEGNPDTKGDDKPPIILPVLVKFLNKDGTDNN